MKLLNQIELIEKKSKFYSFAYQIEGICDVEKILKDLKKDHKKATHICYAYKITNGQELIKFCDDGEPSGTAGRPILNVIEKKNLTNIAVFVVRYFGGVKLGAGGLVRIYTKSASTVLGGENANN